MKLAGILVEEPEEFKSALRRNLKEGMTFPKARSLVLGEVLPGNESEKYQQVLSSPNNILGIEYCKAILRENSSIVPTAIKREGNDYHENSLFTDSFPSASAIRNAVIQSAASNTASLADLARNFLPASCQELFYDAICKNAFLLENDLDSLYRYCLLQENETSLCTYLDMSHSLARRILACQDQYETFSQFADLLKTRDITRTGSRGRFFTCFFIFRRPRSRFPTPGFWAFEKAVRPFLEKSKSVGTSLCLRNLPMRRRSLQLPVMSLLWRIANLFV